MALADAVAGEIDDLLGDGRFAEANAALVALDVEAMPIAALTATLCVARHAHRAGEPGVDYPALWRRCLARFEHDPELAGPRIDRLRQRFAP